MDSNNNNSIIIVMQFININLSFIILYNLFLNVCQLTVLSSVYAKSFLGFFGKSIIT